MEVSNQFKQDVLKFGKQISIKITIGDVTYEKEKIMSCTRSFAGDIFKSFMSYVDIELKDFLEIKNQELKVEFGVRSDNEVPYEYINWGTFIVDNDSIEKSIDKNTTKFTAYDYMVKSCVDYVDIGVSYPITIKDYLNAICDYLGFVLVTENFTNSDKFITEEKFLNSGTWTFRDVFDQIAGLAGGIIFVKGKKLYVKYPTDINYTIDEHNLKSLSILEKWGPVNSLVLSLMPQEDNFYKQDSESIESNGLTEIKIANNEFINKDRETFISDLFDRLNGLYFYPFELDSFGFGWFEPFDLVTIKDIEGKNYQCILLNDTVSVTTGLNEKINSSMPETTVTDYSKATSDEKLLYKTILEVDKQNKKIESFVKETTSKVENLSPISTDTTYQLSDSGTDVPEGVWLINIPEPEKGKYLWTKKIVTYENGRTNTSYDISYFGTDGQDGTSVTVKNTSVMYATSNDITDIPNEWSNERPTDIDQGQYIWTKTTVTYSDGKSTTTYAWNYQGVDGSSVDISSQTVEYQVSDDGTKAPTGEWLSDIPQTAAGQYLWTRSITMYSNGLISTSYSVSYHGLNGDKGEDGTGISSITEEYYLSTSKTSQTGGSWTTTPPTWSSGKYLWTRSKIIYTNPSSTVYTTPICDSSWEAVNEIEIGGRNLLRNSHRTEVTYAYPTSSYLDMFKGVTTVPLNAGTYTLSFWAKSTVDGDKVRVHLYNPSNLTNYTNSQGVTAIAGDGQCDFTLTTKLTKYWVTYTVPKDDSTRSFIVPRVFNGAGSGTLTFKWEKLEEGNKATDWTPAPEDQENIITSDTSPADTSKMWFDTTSNLLKYWNGESWEVANDYADDLNNTRVEITNEYNSAIEQLKSSITSLVEELQTTTSDNSQAVSRLATQIQQNATSISQVITETNSIVDKLSGLSTKEEISKWARFYGEGTDAVLELGASNSPFAVKLSNTELGFYQNGTRIAYLSNQQLNISQAVVLSKLKFSHFEMNDVEIDGYFHLILK